MQIDRITELGEERYCKYCGRWFPREVQYWQVWRGRFWNKCKECQNKYSREYRKKKKQGINIAESIVIQSASLSTEEKVKCSRCRKWYPPTTDYFYLKYGRLRRTCITCHNTPRNKMSPDECSVCGAKKVNLRGDVDVASKTLYGYICAKCSKIVEASNGDYERTKKVFSYLQRRQKKRNMINQQNDTEKSMGE